MKFIWDIEAGYFPIEIGVTMRVSSSKIIKIFFYNICLKNSLQWIPINTMNENSIPHTPEKKLHGARRVANSQRACMGTTAQALTFWEEVCAL